MKTTVKLSLTEAVVIENNPDKPGLVLTFKVLGMEFRREVTPDQWGVIAGAGDAALATQAVRAAVGGAAS